MSVCAGLDVDVVTLVDMQACSIAASCKLSSPVHTTAWSSGGGCAVLTTNCQVRPWLCHCPGAWWVHMRTDPGGFAQQALVARHRLSRPAFR